MHVAIWQLSWKASSSSEGWRVRVEVGRKRARTEGIAIGRASVVGC